MRDCRPGNSAVNIEMPATNKTAWCAAATVDRGGAQHRAHGLGDRLQRRCEPRAWRQTPRCGAVGRGAGWAAQVGTGGGGRGGGRRAGLPRVSAAASAAGYLMRGCGGQGRRGGDRWSRWWWGCRGVCAVGVRQWVRVREARRAGRGAHRPAAFAVLADAAPPLPASLRRSSRRALPRARWLRSKACAGKRPSASGLRAAGRAAGGAAAR